MKPIAHVAKYLCLFAAYQLGKADAGYLAYFVLLFLFLALDLASSWLFQQE